MMAGVSSKTVIVSIKGGQDIALRLNRFKQMINTEQLNTGTNLVNRMRRRAQYIIRTRKAPVTTNQLQQSIEIRTSRSSPGMVKSELFTDVPYAKKVHSGYAPYIERRLTPQLLTWVEDNLGVGARKAVERRGYIRIGYPSHRRNYNPQEGMRFFDIPFAEEIGKIPEEYNKIVDRARQKAQI